MLVLTRGAWGRSYMPFTDPSLHTQVNIAQNKIWSTWGTKIKDSWIENWNNSSSSQTTPNPEKGWNSVKLPLTALFLQKTPTKAQFKNKTPKSLNKDKCKHLNKMSSKLNQNNVKKHHTSGTSGIYLMNAKVLQYSQINEHHKSYQHNEQIVYDHHISKHLIRFNISSWEKLNKLSMKKTYLKIIKAMYGKATANPIPNREKLKAFPFRYVTWQRCCTLTILIQYSTENTEKDCYGRQWDKWHQNWKANIF